ncbi:hypothetical protein QAD02_021318, partial [Eretmocerus hayati]
STMFRALRIHRGRSFSYKRCMNEEMQDRVSSSQKQLIRINLRYKSDESLSQSEQVTSSDTNMNVGAELSTQLMRTDVLRILNSFIQQREIQSLALEHGLD